MQKQKDTQQIIESGFLEVPSFIFRDRSVAVLESLVEYLKDVKKLSFHDIAILLNRDQRTIWTVYYRVRVKRSGIRKIMQKHPDK